MTFPLSLTVNEQPVSHQVEPDLLLVEFLRDVLGLTGTHVGCDSSACGACTVLLNGKAVRSCSLLAVQARGRQVTTIEGLARGEELHPVQQAFHRHHALQCGFCTPGMVLTSVDLVQSGSHRDEESVKAGLRGNLCRCTGYVNIVKAVLSLDG